MKALDIVVNTAFVIALIALPFLVVNWLRYTNQVNSDRTLRPILLKGTPPVKSILFFVIPIFVAMIACSTSVWITHGKVLDTLNSMSAYYVISVNGRILDNHEEILQSLKDTLNKYPVAENRERAADF